MRRMFSEFKIEVRKDKAFFYFLCVLYNYPYVHKLRYSPYVNNLLQSLGGVRKSAPVTTVESSRVKHIIRTAFYCVVV